MHLMFTSQQIFQQFKIIYEFSCAHGCVFEIISLYVWCAFGVKGNPVSSLGFRINVDLGVLESKMYIMRVKSIKRI